MMTPRFLFDRAFDLLGRAAVASGHDAQEKLMLAPGDVALLIFEAKVGADHEIP